MGFPFGVEGLEVGEWLENGSCPDAPFYGGTISPIG